MPGASGATVEVGLKTTRKTGPSGPVLRRLHQQYAWLCEHSDISRVVRVKRRLKNGYEMETLNPILPEQNTAWVLADIAETIWRHTPEIEGDVFTHNHYVLEKLGLLPPSVSDPAYELAKDVMKHWDELHRCLTHGDLTRLNVMRNDKGWLTLIDPIPATKELPDIWAVDMGKILVSALGYDELFLAQPYDPTVQLEPLQQVFNELPSLEVDAVRYLAVVHVARMLPYHRKFPEVLGEEDLVLIAQRALGL